MNKLPIVALLLCSFWMTANTTNSPLDTIVYTDSKITYKTISDDQYIYIKMKTTEESAMISMLRSGFTVYFDAKEKKDVFIKYPNSAPARGQRGANRAAGGERPAINYSSLIELLPKDAEYSFFTDAETYNTGLNTLDINLGFNYQEKAKITNGQAVNLSKLNIGVVSNTRDREASANQQGSGRRTGSGGRGGRGGQRPGGANGNAPTTIDFWFDAQGK